MLHLSDLHAGQRSQQWLLPTVMDSLEDDLAILHRLSGPWDLVAFTGDLSNAGRDEDFQALDRALDRLLRCIERLGSTPALLAVPGNHDARRPRSAAKLRALVEGDRLPVEFWEDAKHPLRAPVASAFEPWQRWWGSRSRSPKIEVWRDGLLPGEFTASVRAGARLIGVAGLNTAALHLWPGDWKGRLPLHPLQLVRATDGEPRAWARRHDAALLLTHHPSSWLSEGGQRALTGEIYLPDRFVAHLAGHVHEESTATWAYGGGEPRQQIVARSLFGREQWDGAQGPERRAHGYSALRLTFYDDHRELRVWPRAAVQDPHDHRWRIERAVQTHQLLEADGGSRTPIRIEGPSFRQSA